MRLSEEINDILMANCETILLKKYLRNSTGSNVARTNRQRDQPRTSRRSILSAVSTHRECCVASSRPLRLSCPAKWLSVR